MGSRKDQTVTYWNKDQVLVVCGCFAGTLPEFEKRVNTVYPSGEYGIQYSNYIKIVKSILELEKELFI